MRSLCTDRARLRRCPDKVAIHSCLIHSIWRNPPPETRLCARSGLPGQVRILHPCNFLTPLPPANAGCVFCCAHRYTRQVQTKDARRRRIVNRIDLRLGLVRFSLAATTPRTTLRNRVALAGPFDVNALALAAVRLAHSLGSALVVSWGHVLYTLQLAPVAVPRLPGARTSARRSTQR